MRLSHKTDIEAPSAFVYSVLTDFENWERFAMRRGVDVTRTDSFHQPTPGMGWLARFRYRSKQREVRLILKSLQPTSGLSLAALTPNIDSLSSLEVIEMSAKRCRLHVVTEIKPISLGARLFLQSLKLARSRVDRRYASRVEALAREIEVRHQQARP